MKPLFQIFILLFCAFCYSQQNNKEIDSLIKVLNTTKEDTVKVKLLNNIAKVQNNLVESRSYAQQSLALAKKIKFKNGEADAYAILGKICHNEYKLTQAIEYYNRSIKIYRQKKDLPNLGNLLYKIANVYNDMSNYTFAMKYYFQAAKVFEETKSDHRLAIVYNQISIIYRGLDDTKKSKYYLDISTNLLLKLNDTEALIYNYINYAQLYEKTKDLGKLEYYSKKSLELAILNNNKNGIAVSLFALSLVDEKKKNYDSAFLKINKALKIFEELANYMGMASAYNELGHFHYNLYKETNNSSHLALAEENFKASNKLYLEADLIDGLSDNYFHISKIYEIERDYKSSLENYHLYSKYNDSMVNTSTKETIKTLEDKRSIELRDRQLILNKIVLKNKEKEKWIYISGILLFGIIGVLLFLQSKNRKRNNENLKTLNLQLDIANKSKIKLFGILNHDLRGPVVNFIHYIQFQQESNLSLDEETKERIESATLASARNLLNSMEDILQWSKSQMESFKPQPTKVSINNLFEEIKNHFSSFEKVEFKIEVLDECVLFTDENYLKTILRNLCGNAIKALEDTNQAVITLNCTQVGDKTVLNISDTGQGADYKQFQKLYEDQSISGIKTGLGFLLIRDLAQAIQCEIVVDSNKNIGTTFKLIFGD